MSWLKEGKPYREWCLPAAQVNAWPQRVPEVRAAASKIHYGSQTEIMAKIVQEKLVPKQARGMRR